MIHLLLLLVVIIGGAVVALPVIFLRAFALSKLWLWFVVPLGHPAYSWQVFFAIAAMINIIFPAQYKEGQDASYNAKSFLAHAFGMSLLLGIAYIIHQW